MILINRKCILFLIFNIESYSLIYRKKNSVAKVKMIKEMYKKNPINNPISVEENHYNDSNSQKAWRVNGYMNSSGLMSNLQQIHVEDDCSEAVSKKNKKRGRDYWS